MPSEVELVQDALDLILTKAGTRALAKETEPRRRLTGLVDGLLLHEP